MCPIFYPMTPFFWDVNIRVANMAVCRLDSEALVAKTLWPQMKVPYSRQKGVIYELDSVYYHG